MSDDWDEVGGLLAKDAKIEAEYQNSFVMGCIVECIVDSTWRPITRDQKYVVLAIKGINLVMVADNLKTIVIPNTYFHRVHPET